METFSGCFTGPLWGESTRHRWIPLAKGIGEEPWGFVCYPTLAREFQGFWVWGKFVFRTLELTDTPTNFMAKGPDGLDSDRWIPLRGGARITLKQKCCHFDEIFVTGCTESCHFDNFQCNQWRRFHQNDDIFISVHLECGIHRSESNPEGSFAFTPHFPVGSRVLGCEENLYFERWNSRTHPPI